MATEKVKSFEKFLVDNGLLFEINRKILHPLGLALMLDVSSSNRKQIYLSGLLQTDDDEGFVFDEETFQHGMEKLKKYLETTGNARIALREKTLGYKEQI